MQAQLSAASAPGSAAPSQAADCGSAENFANTSKWLVLFIMPIFGMLNVLLDVCWYCRAWISGRSGASAGSY